MQKLYAYVDEAGQDALSAFFVVATVVTAKERELMRKKLEEVERLAGTKRKKWHKLRLLNRTSYLQLVIDRKIASGTTYIASYEKPIPYFFPMIDILEKALKENAIGDYQATVYIDGVDRKKAHEITNALRARGISLKTVKSRRDESEPLIRLADMWAGCFRAALLKHEDAQALLKHAKRRKILKEVTP
jgi:ribonuclease HII